MRERKVKFMPYSPWNNALDKDIARERVRGREKTQEIMPIYGKFIKQCR